MRVVIAAGGTGGHFYPGLAVARELMATGDEVSFLIKKGDYVRPLLERENIPFVAISAGGFRRRLDPRHLWTIVKLIAGFFQAFRFFLDRRPNALLVMGGYLSAAPALAARLLGIPVVLHEQNMLPGLANRLVSLLASRVAVSFEPSLPVFKGKAVLTGNPVRREFLNLPPQSEARKKFSLVPEKLTILIFGGSLGAHRLNELLLGAFKDLASHAGTVQGIHIAGAADVTWVRQKYSAMGFNFYVDSYCHDMPAAYSAADLVISRAGASTVAELLAVKKPAILVPYPLATGGHQTANAEVLVKEGVAHLYQQKDLEGGRLKEILERAITNPSEWRASASHYKTVAADGAQAALKIASLIREVAA